jgi:general secretion pathway protein G
MLTRHRLPFNAPALPSFVFRRGFTLIELLTVIAIIGILAAILIPTVGAVRSSAKQVQSISNLRQLGIAITSFTQDHKGSFPSTSHGSLTGADSWIYTLKPYVGNVDEVRICPLDPKGEERLRLRLSSYVLNDYLDARTYLDPFDQPIGIVPRLTTLREPSRTHTLFIGADTLALDTSSDHIHAREWGNNWGQVCADIAPDRFRSASAASPGHTQGRSAYLYADGHVATLPASDFRKLIESGNNPAQPPL